MKTIRILTAGALLLCAAGCGGGLSEVTGTVTFDGHPVAGLQVEFEPKDPNTGTTAIGYTQADGTYKLHYPGDKTGAPAGEYTVKITGSEVTGEGDGDEPRKPVRVAAKYNSKSELTAVVKSGEDNVFNFEVTSK